MKKERFAVIVEKNGKTYNLGTAKTIEESDNWATSFIAGKKKKALIDDPWGL